MLLFLAVKMHGWKVSLYLLPSRPTLPLTFRIVHIPYCVYEDWWLKNGSTGSLNANFPQWSGHSLSCSELFTLNSVFRYLLPSFNLFASSVTLLLSGHEPDSALLEYSIAAQKMRPLLLQCCPDHWETSAVKPLSLQECEKGLSG